MGKILPVLSEMPRIVKEKIVDATDALSKLSLRQCSTEYLELVNKSETAYEELEIELVEGFECIRINFVVNSYYKLFLMFYPHRNGYAIRNLRCERVVRDENFIDGAVNQFYWRFLSGSKVILKNLTITVQKKSLFPCVRSERYPWEHFHQNRSHFFRRMEEAFGMSKRRMKVWQLCLDFHGDQEQLHCILPHLQPGFLERIHLADMSALLDYRLLEMEKITATEQWKQAKGVTIFNLIVDLPFQHWSSFQSTWFHLPGLSITEIDNMIENSKRMPIPFMCFLSVLHCDETALIEYMNQYPRIPEEEDCFKVSMPNPQEWLRVHIMLGGHSTEFSMWKESIKDEKE